MKQKLLLLLFMLVVVFSCDDGTETTRQSPAERFKIIKTILAKEEALATALHSVGFSTNGVRGEDNLTINTNRILKATDSKGLQNTYTISISDDGDAASFTNLVAEQRPGGFFLYFIKYTPATSYTGMHNFSGTTEQYDFNGKLLSEGTFVNGKLMPTPKTNAKATTAEQCIQDVNITETCINMGKNTKGDPFCYEYEWVITYSYGPCGSSEPPPTGGGDGGGSSGGSTGSGPISGGGTPPSNYPPEEPIGGVTPVPIKGYKPPVVPIPEPEYDPVTAWAFTQIFDAALSPCAQGVLTSLKTLGQGSLGSIIQKFSGETPGYNWELKDGYLPPNINGQTTYDKKTKKATTLFDQDKFKDGSDLAVARTLLHEAVHAYLITMMSVDPINFNETYGQLIDEYWKMKHPNLDAAHHEEMTRNFVADIAATLKAYGDSKNYVAPTDTYYNDLAWGGLEETKAYQNKSSTEKERINSVFSTEQRSVDYNGNGKMPIGKKSGCGR